MEFEDYAGILYDKAEKYYIIKKIGDGATSFVYLCKTKDNVEYAVKIYTNSDAYINEVKILSALQSSKYIVQLITFGEGFIERGCSLETYELTSHFSLDSVQFCIFEYLSNGDLFNYIVVPHQGFPEGISKKIFSNLLEAIETCHNSGIIHGDIKLENILLSSDFSVKLIDFGFSKEDTDQFIYEYIGTRCYSSPEMFIAPTNGFEGKKSDVFSLGVVLFAICMGRLPFNCASYSDQKYRCIIKNDYANFWKNFNSETIGESLKELVCKMLWFNPDERIKINDIKAHSWLNEKNEEQCSDEEKNIAYQKEFAMRKEIVDNYIKKKNEYIK